MDRSEWVLVPRKVTREMLIEFWTDVDGVPPDDDLLVEGDLGVLQRDWDRLLAAAPPPPAEQASGEHVDVLIVMRAGKPMLTPREQNALDHAIVALSQRPVVPDGLTDFLDWAADELVKRDQIAGNFTHGLSESLKGRAAILRLAPQQPEKKPKYWPAITESGDPDWTGEGP